VFHLVPLLAAVEEEEDEEGWLLGAAVRLFE
jgi:hypothetical protein